MSMVTSAWQALYGAQTAFLGQAILATVTGYATNKPAVIGSKNLDLDFISGGEAQEGRITIQMLASDFSEEPDKGIAFSCNGSLLGEIGLVLLESPENNNGIYYLTVGDFAYLTK